MLKTISAALLAASVLVAAPAMAHSPGRTAHGPSFGIVHVNPVFNANARMGRHHYRYHHRHHHKHFRHHHHFHPHH